MNDARTALTGLAMLRQGKPHRGHGKGLEWLAMIRQGKPLFKAITRDAFNR